MPPPVDDVGGGISVFVAGGLLADRHVHADRGFLTIRVSHRAAFFDMTGDTFLELGSILVAEIS